MRKWLIIIVLAAFFVTLSGTSWSIQNPSISNPAGISTTPASSISSGLISSPSSGNPVITGNVRGGRYYQGSVPYGASTGFGATLGSTSLDSFLRSSAGSEYSDYYSGRYGPQPFYSPTGTVTTTTPGLPGVFNLSATQTDSRASGTSNLKISSQAASGTSSSLQVQTGTFSTQNAKVPDSDLIPIRISSLELEKLISDGVAVAGRAKRLVDEDDIAQMERLQRDLKQLRLKASDLRQSLVVRDDSLRPFNKLKLDENKEMALPINPQELKETTEQRPSPDLTQPLQGKDQSDLQEQLRQQLDNLQKALEQQAAKQTEKTADEKEKPSREEPYSEILSKPIDKESELEGSLKYSRERILAMDEGEQSSELPESKKDVLSLSDTNVSARAKLILREYKTFSSFLEDKSRQHINTAEFHLKQGRYYQAVDAYTLASIYQPNDPLSHIGKSHALFAAGEYMSSSLFLSRALKISPEQVKTKVDFVAIFGGEDKLETRITDLEEWQQRSKAAELEFLLGYVYYQIGRLQDAQKMINTAYEKDPKSPAVVTVKKAIEDALSSTNTK